MEDSSGLDDSVRNDIPFRMHRMSQRFLSGLANRTGKRPFHEADFEVVRKDLEIADLPHAFENYEIVHLSDIHYGQWISADRLNGVVSLIARYRPDLVVITGDFVSYDGEWIDELSHILDKLNPRDATLSVLGNHDHWFGASKIRSVLRKANVMDLDNDIYTIKRYDASETASTLHIAGVDSVMIGKDRLEKVLQKLPADGPAILLCHEPNFADVSASTGRFSLQLSGHSHGGQFIIPGIGTPVRKSYFWKYPHGMYRVKNMTLYTNRGIGCNNVWIRINAKPEITFIVLHAMEQSIF